MPKEKIIEGRVFRNERVLIDGISYRNCRFENVTLVYNGGSVDLQENGFAGFVLASDRPEIINAFKFLFNLGLLKLSVVDDSGPLKPSNSMFDPTAH